MKFIRQYLESVRLIAARLDVDSIEQAVDVLARVRSRNGRLFILGVGGSAANASHAVNDFRKICGFECYAPTDNVAELTARTNDEGWESVFATWLENSKFNKKDGLLVFSVGGGNTEKKVSMNIVHAVVLATKVGATVIGIVGRDGGHTAKTATACIIVPIVDDELVTPLTEAFQAVIWHLLVSHPKLKITQTKWESLQKK